MSHIGRRFFRELMRRRSERLGLTLLVAAAPGTGDEMVQHFEEAVRGPVVRVDLPAAEEPQVGPDEAAGQAQDLEDRVGADPLEVQIHLPHLIRHWRAAERADRLFVLLLKGLDIFNTLGFYEDAMIYGEAARGLSKSGSVFLRMGRYEEARADYLTAIELSPPYF